MSSKRDLVEAHAFNRRRLVTAFISGAPGGREVEPVRPARTLVGGLVLALLIVAGAAVAGLIRPTVADGWNEFGLVVGKETGSRYLAYDGELYPVINTTSARLMLDEFRLNTVPEEMIAEENPGVTIGIPGAPDALPGPGDLVQDGWASCVNSSGQVKTTLSRRPGATQAEDEAVVVQAGRSTYVVTGTSRHVVPPRDRDSVLRALGLDGQTIRTVPGVWLDLFPEGSPLEPFAVEGSGQPVPAGLDVPPQAARVGTVLLVDGRPFVVAQDGLLGLDDVRYAMYRSGGEGASLPEVEVSAGDVAGLPSSEEAAAPRDWPSRDLTSFVPATDDTGLSVCALLETVEDGAGQVHLARPTAELTAVPDDDDGDRVVEVDSGRGALVQANPGAVVNRGRVYLVDASGTIFPLDDLETTQPRLGLADVEPADVPITWTEVFPPGPVLSPDEARKPAVEQ